jgi:hypothetical protein
MSLNDVVVGHFDVQCPRCGKRHGWSGVSSRAPACPRCGYADPAPLVGPDAAELVAFRQFLRDRKAAKDRAARERDVAGDPEETG